MGRGAEATTRSSGGINVKLTPKKRMESLRFENPHIFRDNSSIGYPNLLLNTATETSTQGGLYKRV